MLKPAFFGGPLEPDEDREIGLDSSFPPSLWSREDIAMVSLFATNGEA